MLLQSNVFDTASLCQTNHVNIEMHHVMKFSHRVITILQSCMLRVLWKEEMNYCVSKKGRILVPGRAIVADFRRLVIDHMISNGGDNSQA